MAATGVRDGVNGSISGRNLFVTVFLARVVHRPTEAETTGSPPSHLSKCSPWSNLGLGGHSYELVPGLGINVGEALRRSEAPRFRSEVLERDRLAECLWLGER